MIYDGGNMVAHSKALGDIARKPFLALAESDARRLGLDSGTEATVSVDGFEAHLEVVVDDISPGAVFVPYDQPGLHANRLMSGRNATVRVSPR
jgi:predicted molibdopterin-dependent oxidoreductase YjgC